MLKKIDFKKYTFSEKVLEALLLVPKGKVTTYGDLAKAVSGSKMGAMAVTSCLFSEYKKAQKTGKEIEIPFHRVVYSDGRIWTSPKIKKQREEIYRKEKIEIKNGKIKNFVEIRWKF